MPSVPSPLPVKNEKERDKTFPSPSNHQHPKIHPLPA
jgi:hypothetical protein